MLSPSLTQRLQNQHTTIRELIAKLDDQQVQYRPEPGKWNIHDNIAHLATYQPIFLYRINQILATDNPSFPRYRADDDENFIAWRDKPLDELLEKISAERQETVKLITGIPEDQLNRKGLHPKFGNLTILEWTEFFLLHEAHHLFTIFRLANGG